MKTSPSFPLSWFPVAFLVALGGSFVTTFTHISGVVHQLHFSPCPVGPDALLSYPQFLAKLKAWGVSIGLCPRDIGTHSLRRGLSSDWALQGIPDRLRREHGRWRSEKVADWYIDASINIQLLLHSLRK